MFCFCFVDLYLFCLCNLQYDLWIDYPIIDDESGHVRASFKAHSAWSQLLLLLCELYSYAQKKLSEKIGCEKEIADRLTPTLEQLMYII